MKRAPSRIRRPRCPTRGPLKPALTPSPPPPAAAAILIDATIIRGVLLPATMKLLGDWNWYLPHSLRWLPKIRGAQRREDGKLRPEAARA